MNWIVWLMTINGWLEFLLQLATILLLIQSQNFLFQNSLLYLPFLHQCYIFFFVFLLLFLSAFTLPPHLKPTHTGSHKAFNMNFFHSFFFVLLLFICIPHTRYGSIGRWVTVMVIKIIKILYLMKSINFSWKNQWVQKNIFF